MQPTKEEYEGTIQRWKMSTQMAKFKQMRKQERGCSYTLAAVAELIRGHFGLRLGSP